MLQTAQFLATLCGTLFAGAAIYINLVEHPARMGLGTKAAAAEWAPSYTREDYIGDEALDRKTTHHHPLTKEKRL
jgi:hypothetical protein